MIQDVIESSHMPLDFWMSTSGHDVFEYMTIDLKGTMGCIDDSSEIIWHIYHLETQ